MRILLFTDLDNCLLDHGDYTFDAARPALEELRRRGIPLIINTSKTRAETVPILERLGIDDPFIVENGGAVYLPPSWRGLATGGGEASGRFHVFRFGAAYAALREFLRAHRDETGTTGFGDMAAEEISRITGLGPDEAKAAMEREHSEPFLISDERRLPALREAAARHGLAVTRGGRFFHLVAVGQDKGRAAAALIQRLQAPAGEPIASIGVGDGENDIPLLAVVTHPIVMPAPHGRSIACRLETAMRARHAGPRGWNESVLSILSRLA